MTALTPDDQHDDQCEAEYVVGAACYTDCGCHDRARQVDTEIGLTCTHCGAGIDEHPGGSWGHRVGPGPRFYYLNRCQSSEVPYGHEAHPASAPCPDWCMGHYEPQPCTHKEFRA